MRRTLVFLLLVVGCLVPSRFTVFQQAHAQSIVVHSSANDVSPRLSQMPPLKARPSSEADLGETERRNPPQPVSTAPLRTDSAVQTSLSSGGVHTAGVSVPQVLTSWNGIDSSHGSGIPPDPNGDVGPHDYVQTVNSALEIWSKDGTSLLGPIAIDTLWQGFGGACEERNDGDPIVVYDHLADRWLISQFTDASPYYQCIAVSTSSDPTGSYYRYAWLESTTDLQDYPKMTVWPDGYYMAAKDFSSAGSYQGPTEWVFDRSAMLQGLSATKQSFPTNPSPYREFMFLAADLDGSPPPSGTPEYFVMDDGGTSKLYVYAFHVDWTTPANTTFTSLGALSVAGWSMLCNGSQHCVAQEGTSTTLDGLGYLMMNRLAYRWNGSYGTLVVDHNADVGSSRGGLRWYEIHITGSTPSLIQQSTYAPADGISRWTGSTAQDDVGDTAIVFDASSSTMYPSIRLAGRLSTDTANTLTTGDISLFDGTGSQIGADSVAGYRWGDYASLKVDPSDDCTYWYSSEYNSSNGTAWSTRIGSFRFSGCDISPTGVAVTAPSANKGSVDWVTVTARDSSGHVATGYTGTVHFTSGDPAAVLPADYTFTAADSGSHTFPVTFGTQGTQTVTGTDTATSSFTDTATVDVSAPATSLTIDTPASATSGIPFNVTVTARASGGGVDTGYTGTIHLSSGDTAALLPADYTFTAADAGSHTFSVRLGTQGSQTISAADTGGNASLSVTSAPIDVTTANTFVEPATSGGNDASDCLTATTACATVNGAIAKTSAAGTVTIAPGTYTGAVSVDRDVTLQGNGSGVILDGGNTTRVVHISLGVTATLSDLTVQHGNAGVAGGGGIFNQGTLYLTRVSVLNNTESGGIGGGIDSPGPLTILDSTIAGNSATNGGYGGGLYAVSSAVSIVNSTFANNTAGTGGAIRMSSGSLSIADSTISGNSSGIAQRSISPLLSNSILAGNGSYDCLGPLTDGGHDILGSTASGCSGLTNGVNGDHVGVSASLGALGDNGGPTQTMMPASSSPAIDAGDNAACAASPANDVDQRLYPRTSTSNGTCDIGSVESAAVPTMARVAHLSVVRHGSAITVRWRAPRPAGIAFFAVRSHTRTLVRVAVHRDADYRVVVHHVDADSIRVVPVLSGD
jgi:hypothetical protein